MLINSTTHKAYNYLLDLIFPVLCVECGHEGTYLCPKCLTRVAALTMEQLCPACAKPSPFGKTHPQCESQTSLSGFIHALRYKDSTVRRLVELFKYHGIKDIGALAGGIMSQEIQNQSLENYFQAFVIVPIPLHPKRLKWRGYNQSDLMGQAIANKFGWAINNKLLIKAKHSTAQAKLNKKQRQENLVDAFDAPSDCTNLKILIIDDVATTRATLNQAANVLKKARAKEVWALTLAYED